MKPQYCIRNWSEYNAGLKQRGSLTFWVEESILEQWVVKELGGKPGASILYSDLAIQTMATLKAIYRLAGRQCQGFLESIFELMGIDLPVPDHSTLSRRLGQLSVELPVLTKEGARHVVVDSTGVKVYGEGSGKPVNTERASDAPGASCIWAWMRQPAKSWRQWRQPMISMMEKY